MPSTSLEVECALAIASRASNLPHALTYPLVVSTTNASCTAWIAIGHGFSALLTVGSPSAKEIISLPSPRSSPVCFFDAIGSTIARIELTVRCDSCNASMGVDISHFDNISDIRMTTMMTILRLAILLLRMRTI